MSVNNSNVESLLSQIQKYTDSTGTISATQEDLEALFEDQNYYNAGSKGKEEIEEQIETLEKAIEALQKEAEDLQAEIEEANLSIDAKSEELAEVVSQINEGTEEYHDAVAKAVRAATSDAIDAYKTSKSKTDFASCFESAWNKQTIDSSIDMNGIKALYAQYDEIKDTCTPILSTIDGYLTEISGIQTRLDNTNATINLLTTTMNNMTDTIKSAYTNDDYSSSIPTYSGAKAELVDEFLGTYTSRYDTDVDAGTSASTEITAAQQEVMDKWLEQKGDAEYTSGDKYNVATNPELANLRSLYESGMIEELSASGLNADQILTFVSENWNVGITKDSSTGNWKIPKGHSADSWCKEGVYAALSDLVTNSETNLTADSVNQAQMQELSTAIYEDDILTKMYESGFTFKEAMYALTKLFPDAGITYNLSDQTSNSITYSRVTDSSASGTLYSDIAEQILEYWDVGSTTTVTEDTSTTQETTRYDPITFQSGDTTYTFITDRNGDGDFDYTDGSNNELLGSETGIEELLAYDYNGDGVIDDNDIATDENGNALTTTDPDGTVRNLTALDQLTLMSNQQIENVDLVDGVNSVDFNVTYTSARLAGITSINLSGLSGTGTGDDVTSSTKDYDNVSEGYDDINGSSVINQFSITMSDGTTVNANETLNTSENLETFYGQVADKAGSMYSSIEEGGVADAYTSWATDAAEATDELLDSMKANLQDLREQAKDAEGDEEFELNISWAEFQELYGTDGRSGTYTNMVKETAVNTGESYAKQTLNASASETTKIKKEAKDAIAEVDNDGHVVGGALNDLNESYQVEVQLVDHDKEAAIGGDE